VLRDLVRGKMIKLVPVSVPGDFHPWIRFRHRFSRFEALLDPAC
jgi:hypothetical protein